MGSDPQSYLQAQHEADQKQALLDFFGVQIRPEILEFARMMEIGMRRHDEDYGDIYKSEQFGETENLWALMDHLGKIGNNPQGQLGQACADAANYLMFIALRDARK